MLTLEQLRDHMMKSCLPAPIEANKYYLSFIVQNEKGETRMGMLDLMKAWYEEVSNFQTPRTVNGVDYCDEDQNISGLYRFWCDVDMNENPHDFIAGAKRDAEDALERMI